MAASNKTSISLFRYHTSPPLKIQQHTIPSQPTVVDLTADSENDEPATQSSKPMVIDLTADSDGDDKPTIAIPLASTAANCRTTAVSFTTHPKRRTSNSPERETKRPRVSSPSSPTAARHTHHSSRPRNRGRRPRYPRTARHPNGTPPTPPGRMPRVIFNSPPRLGRYLRPGEDLDENWESLPEIWQKKWGKPEERREKGKEEEQ